MGGGATLDRPLMRVAYVQACDGLGAERQASLIISRLGAFGIEVVPLLGSDPRLCRWLAEQDVRGAILSRALSAPRSNRAGDRGRGPGWDLGGAPAVSAQIEAIVAEGAIDLVLAAGPCAWMAATRAARRQGIPIVWHAEGREPGPLQAVGLWTWSRVRPPDLLVCASESVRASFEPLVSARVQVVRQGVDVEMFRPGRGHPGVFRPPGAAFVVGFAGALSQRKRPLDFVTMAARLVARHQQLSFLVAGEGPWRARCEQLVHAYGLERCVRFLGFVADMTSFLAACDVLVQPSDEEGCPSVVLEAMAAERPVVVAGIPAMIELVAPGETGLVYPVGDVDAGAEAISRLVQSPGACRGLARAARAHVCKHFDARVTVGRLAAVLEGAREERGRGDASRRMELADARAGG
jgi:glycosyltransferase involved in cell wall biosynthesis